MRRSMQGVPVTDVRAEDGASLTVADHGAHVLSWIPAGGSEALFLSERSGFGGAAIRGGVPVIFPQFAERGTGKRHGFARTAAWRLVGAGIENGGAVVRYALSDADVPGNAWPHRFLLHYEVSVFRNELRMALSVGNPSSEPWSFCAALHSYWRVDDVDRVQVSGLRDCVYIDQVAGGTARKQEEDALRIEGEIDRIYGGVATAGGVRLADGQRIIALGQEGFHDAVVWNPHAAKAPALSDLAPGDYRRFLCIEAGAILQAVTLAPGGRWQGTQTARIHAV